MDNSSKKVVVIIAAAALGIMAVMAFNNYNQPAAEIAPIADAPEAVPADTSSAVTQSQAQVQAAEPINAAPITDDIPAINGEPSMILEGSNNAVNEEGNGETPATADTME